ncbi:type II transport protein GspH [Aquincola sp. S2]|uniref:Type II secretion system protein H n=1 Tax=Pseudaquabacterium terrae TaxID=2732868 RepID=A0ABX2EV75_9BURK|nr:GspH/FimT family pseudopilin [Aquabacterium terrae]NRF72324.1 type II transport protein GspH [Aquabacterium terrae]
MPCRRVRGLTLIEVVVAIAIAAIMLGLAAPSFVESIARTRLEGAVSTLGIDVQYARSEAIRRRTNATLTILSGGASYTIGYTPTSGADVVLKTVALPSGVSLSAAGPIVFEGLRGTTAAETITGSSSQTGAQLRVTTNAFGRISTCSPGSSLHGYTAC